MDLDDKKYISIKLVFGTEEGSRNITYLILGIIASAQLPAPLVITLGSS